MTSAELELLRLQKRYIRGFTVRWSTVSPLFSDSLFAYLKLRRIRMRAAILLSLSTLSPSVCALGSNRGTFEAGASGLNPYDPFQVFGNASIGPELTIEHLFLDQVRARPQALQTNIYLTQRYNLCRPMIPVAYGCRRIVNGRDICDLSH